VNGQHQGTGALSDLGLGLADGYLIDTNVISELRRRQPELGVVGWFE
jgi:hypothetical protein